jgi:hypothetical protein
LKDRLEHLKRVHRFHFTHYKMLADLAAQHFSSVTSKTENALNELNKILDMVEKEIEQIDLSLKKRSKAQRSFAENKLEFFLNDVNSDKSRKLATSRHSQWESIVNELTAIAASNFAPVNFENQGTTLLLEDSIKNNTINVRR